MMRRSKEIIVLVAAFIVAVVACQNSTSQKSDEVVAVAEQDSTDQVERGGYLIKLGGCGDCHSPKVMTAQGPAEDEDRLLSGYDPLRPFVGYAKDVALSGTMVVFNVESTAFAGPWGVSYAANLTPHNSGLGGWTFERFRKAMKEGKWKGMDDTRPLSPPMPWQNYRDVTDEDLQAMFAYLQSLTPIDNPIPVPIHRNAL